MLKGSIFNTSFAPLTANTRPKYQLIETARVAAMHHERVKHLYTYLVNDVATFPEITGMDFGKLKHACSVIEYGKEKRLTICFRIQMPDEESELLWFPWLEHQAQPQHDPGDYHHIKPGPVYALQARRTKCYDHAYAYSGQTHPIEEETPDTISGLYTETNALMGYKEEDGLNMCLENNYSTGRHYISEHSDDERAFSESVHDVCCWITGTASREGIFRTRHPQGKKTQQKKREILKIKLPAGLYVMKGREFQQRYSHEFPIFNKGLFTYLCKARLKGFPTKIEKTDKGASKTALVQADWLKENADLRDHPPRKRKEFEEWCRPRTSYTLRSFKKKK